MKSILGSNNVISCSKGHNILVADMVVGVKGQVELLEAADLRALTAISCCSQITDLKGIKRGYTYYIYVKCMY